MKSKVKKQTFEEAIVQIITPLGFVQTGDHQYEKPLHDDLAWVVFVGSKSSFGAQNVWSAAKADDIDVHLPTTQHGKGIASFREFLKKNKLTRRAA